jgi:signal transduction histidine kinase
MDRSKNSDPKANLQDILYQLLDEKKEIEKKYFQARTDLNLLKDQMKNLNHDLRGPLGGISELLGLMIIEDEKTLEVPAFDLIMIRNSTQSLLELVNGAQLASETQKSMNGSKSIDRKLSSAMMEVHSLYFPMAHNKDISLSLSSQTEAQILLSLNVFINLIQIIGNLVANAIKFTPAGGTIEVNSITRTQENHSILYLTVTDTGKGMLPDQVSAFNRGEPVARSNGTNGEKGSGIGLHHVQEMVTEDTGHITVKSRKGSGTTFSLTYPLSDLTFIRESTDLSAATIGFVSVNGHQR